jgi:hypothetical protein
MNILNKNLVTSAVTSMAIGTVAALIVSIYTYVNQSNELRDDLYYQSKILESKNYELKDEINKLKDQILKIESNVDQNRSLIETVDTNLKFQADVVRSLLPANKSKVKL